MTDKHREVLEKIEHTIEDEDAIMAEFAEYGTIPGDKPKKEDPIPGQMTVDEWMSVDGADDEDLPFN